jgi:uncharacterized protein YbjT (DUF2867 family)
MILITGGTGFVGRHLIARLHQQGEQVRALARSPQDVPGAEPVQADITDTAAIGEAARGCQAVIHLVGILRERRGAGFRRVHVEGTRSAIEACREAEVPRLLHMSALGTRPNARSRYHGTKWRAEELVRESGLQTTIFRPSVIFGDGGSFLPQIRSLVRRAPIVPIPGGGMSLIQPIWVEDVVSCFMGALGRPETVGRTYELGGPETYGFEQLIDLVAESEGVELVKLHLPIPLLRPAVAVLSRVIPRFPLTSDQLTMLLEDNVCDIAEMRETFGVEPRSVRDHLAE